jgi:3-oxoacyl-[acyl-carrier protein] reductase
VNPGELGGRVAVVTGGAGGLGSAICRALATAGSNVVVGFNQSADKAVAVRDALPDVEGGHYAMRAPVTDSPSLARLAREIDARFGRCDILVNCAGTTRFVPHADLDALDDGLIDSILATNVRGPFATLRALLPMLRRSRSAVVINISSIAAVTANGSNVMYCASKAAVDNMTRSLARALAPQVRVLSVSPGLVDTEFIQQLDAAWRDEQVGRTPLGSLATPADIAQAVLTAISKLTFTTGAVIPVDGGRPLM